MFQNMSAILSETDLKRSFLRFFVFNIFFLFCPLIFTFYTFAESDSESGSGIESGLEKSKDYVLYDMEEQFRKINSEESGTFTVNYFDSNTIVQDSFENTTVRRIYDENRHLIHKEVWSVAASAEESELEYSEDYFYADGNIRSPEKSITKNYKEKYRLESSFNERGLKISEKRFSFEDDYLEESNTWQYDEKKRVVEEETTLFPKNSKKTTKKNVYVYKPEIEEPDYSFYENGSLRLRKVYDNPDTYRETAYFDNGFTVETVFKHGIKTEVSKKLNGRVIDRVEYEKL